MPTKEFKLTWKEGDKHAELWVEYCLKLVELIKEENNENRNSDNNTIDIKSD